MADIQNSNEGSMDLDLNIHPKPYMNLSQVLVGDGNSKAWFYPSKGLNELFSQAGKLVRSRTKTCTTTKPNLRTHSTSLALTQRR
jgi:hypothetical protein